MNTTRTAELELLEIGRDKVKDAEQDGRYKRRGSILESIFEQVKDPYLEKMRKELHRWVVSGLENVPDEGTTPTKKQRNAMAEAQINIERIEALIQQYVQSPAVRDSIIKKMHKHDPTYAESIVVKQKRRSS